MSDRLARSVSNECYERGWREGWVAALAKVEHDGLTAVLDRERSLPPTPMTLAFERPLDEVHVVDLSERIDGLYVFAEAADADRFARAAQAGHLHNVGVTTSEPVIDSAGCDELIAAERESHL